MRGWLINIIIKHLFKGITAKEILRVVSSNTVFYKDRKLTHDQRQALKQSAEHFAESPLWRFLSDDVQYVAEKKITTHSKMWEDVYFGKAALWVIAVIQEKIEQLKKLD